MPCDPQRSHSVPFAAGLYNRSQARAEKSTSEQKNAEKETMTLLRSPVELDTWIPASWEDFLQTINLPEHQKHKAYYYNGNMRIEQMSTGFDHSTAHAFLMNLISMYCLFHGILLTPCDGCSYRKTGLDEFQPDASYYFRENVSAVPEGTRVVDLDRYPVPDLVIEVSDTTLSDDKGNKRLQYEDLRIPEYWILDVKSASIIAFTIEKDGSSKRVEQSVAIPGFAFSLAEAALRQRKNSNYAIASNWFMKQLNG